MMNNCKRRSSHQLNDGQHKRQCNRFMSAKLHFDKSISLIVLFVYLLFPYHYQVLADDVTYSATDKILIPDAIVQILEEKTQLPEKELEFKTIATIIHNENNATNNELNRIKTEFVVNNVVLTHSYPHDGYAQLKSEEEVTTSIPLLIKEEQFNSLEHTLDVNNNIYTDGEERAENKILPYLVNAHQENALLNENLEASIRNSVKAEVELEQNLESSPVLEILKDLPEAEIRKTLTADILSLDQETLDNNFMLLPAADTENSKPEPIPEVIVGSQENISNIVESSEIKTVNTRDSRNLQFQEAENSGEPLNVPDPDHVSRESSKAVYSSLTISLANNSSENSCDSLTTIENDLVESINQESNEDITNLEKVTPTVPETNYEFPSTSDVSIFTADETAETDNVLSIVLNETFSTLDSFSGEEPPTRIEDNVEITTEEQVERITMIPEEQEHVVVKKVLNVEGIFNDFSETTFIPFEDQTQKPAVNEENLFERNDGDYFAKTELFDDYNHDLSTKGHDREAKQVYEDQKPELDNYSQELNSKEQVPEATLVHEDQAPKQKVHEEQNPELNSENTSKLVESKVKSSHNDESINLHNINQLPPPYPENEQEQIELQPNKESQSLHNHLKVVEHTENPQNSENKSRYDKAATFFEAYLPRDSGQTFNNNLADEFAGIGKALPISISDGSSRSTIIIVLSSGTALLFVVISLTIFLISFQRQNGTLDIEMQERSCGKDDLDEEDVETFSKLLEVELPPSVALNDTEECL